MELKYYYEDNRNAKGSLRGGLILAIAGTFLFAISNKSKVDRVGILSFAIECVALFFVIFSIGVVVALINYIINRCYHTKHKTIIESGRLCNAEITGVSYKRNPFSVVTGARFSCELSITYEPDLFRVTGLETNDGFAFLLKYAEQLENHPIPIRAYIKDKNIYADLSTAKLDNKHFENSSDIMYDMVDRY